MSITLSIDMAGVKKLREALADLFQPPERADIMEKACKAAVIPLERKLEQVTPLGPTGNLRRAIDSKTSKYPKDGNATGLVGFRMAGRGKSTSAAGGSIRSGPDRAFHQFWVEGGTRDRVVNKRADKPFYRQGHARRGRNGRTTQVVGHTVKRQGGYIASSFNELGEFGIASSDGRRVTTVPGYPRAFFRKSATPITIPAMNPGGSGDPPLAAAWEQSRATVEQVLIENLRQSFQGVADQIKEAVNP